MYTTRKHPILRIALISMFGLSGCTVNLTDETSNFLNFNPPANLQTFRADVSKRGSVTINGVTVNLDNGGSAPLGGSGVGIWQGSAGLAPCEQVVSYKFTVDYYRGNSTTSKFKTFPENGSFVRSISNTDPLCDGVVSASKTFNVDTYEDLADANPGDGFCRTGNDEESSCSLRAAVMEANALPGTDLIRVPNGRYVLTREKPSGSESDNVAEDAWGDLDITDSVAIVGNANNFVDIGNFMLTEAAIGIPGGRLVDVEGDIDDPESDASFPKIDGGQIDRVFQIHEINGNEGFALFKNIAILNGDVIDRPGGGIFNQGVLRLERVAVYDNTAMNFNSGGVGAANRGAGINSTGIIVGTEVAVVNNRTTGGGGIGGGMFLDVRSNTVLEKSLIAFNEARFASAMYIQNDNENESVPVAQIELTNTTIFGNDNSGTVQYTIKNDGNLTMNFVTVLNNLGGGLLTESGAKTTLSNSYMATDYTGGTADCSGPITSLGNNVIRSYSCVGSLATTDLVNPPSSTFFSINSLTNKGGFTYVSRIRPPSTSSIIDLTDRINGPINPPSEDQRGASRPYDADGDGTADYDVGAYEFDGTP